MASKDTTIAVTYKVADVNGGFKQLTLDADGLRKIMEKNVEVTQEMTSKVFRLSAAFNTINSANNALDRLSSALSNLTGESIAFANAMAEANTMAGKDAAGFKELKGQVADLAKEIPIARDLLANGLYQTISNGVPEDNWIEFLKNSARSAVGGLADINKVVGVTSTVIKNYGLDWSDAAAIQDKIQLTAKNGVTSFEQLAQALPRVTGNAATLGVTIDELMGTFATLTGVSGNTAEVSTQLAAIFTSLVKPSSEASKMAAQMGIQFDAAAIKAAGGFQNFLTQLDSSIKAYAQANGVLEQEVYGRLFGSAEALRALIPLQGELAEKFASNVDLMVDSAGTMDEAFTTMANEGGATATILANYWNSVIDKIAGITSYIQPVINFSNNVLSSAANVGILVMSLKSLNVQQIKTAVGGKLLSGTIKTIGLFSKQTRLGLEMLAISGGKAAAGMAALKVALRGLLVASGVGVAIWALSSAIGYMMDKSDEATQSLEQFDDATDEYTRSAANAKVQIEQDIKTLGELIKSNDDTTDAVKRLNKTYGDLFGTRNSASEWYDTLISKSKDYIKYIGYEAQAIALRDKLAEALVNKDLADDRVRELEASGKHKQTSTITTGGSITGVTTSYTGEFETEEYKNAKKAQAEANAEVEQRTKAFEKISDKAGQLHSQLQADTAATNAALQVNEMNWQQVADAISETETSLKTTTDHAKIDKLKAYNEQLKARKKILEQTLGLSTSGGSSNGLTDPGDMYSFTSLEQFTQKRRYLQQLSEKADFEQKARYDEQIAQLDELQKRLETQAKWKRDGVTVERFHSDTPTIKTTSMSAPPETVSRRLGGVDPTATSLPDITENIKALNEQLDNNRNIGMYEAGLINEQIAMWEKKAEAIRNAGKAAEDTTSVITNAVGSMGSSLSSLGDSLELPALNVAGTMAQAVATLALSFAKMMDKTAPMGPFGWLAFGATGLAQLVAMVSTVKSLPAFANGGIISGPTIGLMGEYPGAANNPEVVAPLNTLTDLIQPAAAPVGGKVVFEISGRNLRGVLQKEERFIQRT